MKETDLAYLAGTIDSDGYIICLRYKRKDRKSYLRYTPRVGVVTHFPAVVDFLKSIDFLVYQKKNYPSKLVQNSNVALWECVLCGGKKVGALLKELLPYLKGKKERARILLQFIEMRRTHPRKGYTEEEIELMERLKSLK